MRTRGKLLLFTLLAGGAAVVLRGRRSSPASSPESSQASEPFMAPSASPTGSSAARRPSVRPADAPVPAEDMPHPVPGAVDVEGDRDAGDEDAVDPLPAPPHGPFTTRPDGPADDLKRITGIGPKLETLLNEQGITTFAQLAALDEDDVEALQARLPEFPGRIRRDEWVAQAARLRDAG